MYAIRSYYAGLFRARGAGRTARLFAIVSVALGALVLVGGGHPPGVLAEPPFSLRPRITSYNVCYTKLLRRFINFATNISIYPWSKYWDYNNRNIGRFSYWKSGSRYSSIFAFNI